MIDTNVLILPYGLKQESLDEIKRIYEVLLKCSRLFTTTHTLREFAIHRSPRISELFTEVDKALSTVPSINGLDYPILAELDAHKKLIDFRNGFSEYIKPYKELLQDLQATIRSWNWGDPLTELYAKVFNSTNILDNPESEDQLAKEFEQRMKDGIPPGNKDAGKSVNAIWDFLIWKAILELGKSKNANIMLVTDDEKNDWMLKGNKKSISTKFGLADEFQRITSGRQFTCINFAGFLKLHGANKEVIAEVSEQEEAIKPLTNYLQGKDALLKLKLTLEEYIDSYDNSGEHFLINNSVAALMDELVVSLNGPYFDKYPQRRYLADQISGVLRQFATENYTVEFEFYRAKKSVVDRQANALRYARQLLDLIEECLF